ncbi:MAG TPA: hypothetical protein VEF90_17725 [Xanthobacteraceae bacterium]|nr:hypothetical protein [Xanthobacteraceae bacterium]
MSGAAKVYRADRRNAARKAGVLAKWRDKPRLRSAEHGVRSGRDETGRMKTWLVYTYVVGA